MNNLPFSVEEDLYLIAQEALDNVLKHANATDGTVHMRANADGVSLEVVDNGKGFNVDSVRRKGGMGLLSMRQRAERLGGRLTILFRSGPGNEHQGEPENAGERIGLELTRKPGRRRP